MKQNVTQHVSYYDVLNVSTNATHEEIKRAYRKMALRFHPDRNRHDRRMAEYRIRLINEAYSALKTPEKRARYDRRQRAQNDNIPSESIFHHLTGFFWPSKTMGRKSANKHS